MAKRPPRVSIVVSAFNQAAFLAETLESALAVRHADLEVVVVDDGSTDETPRIAGAQVGRPGFRYVRQENRGLSGARNRGIEESSGEYLIFLDADDRLAPSMVETLLPYFDVDERLAFVYCDTVHIDERGQPLDDAYSVGTSRARTSGDILDSLLLGGYFPVHAALVRRSALREAGEFDRTLDAHEDYDLWLRLASLGYTARYVDEKLVSYRKHPGSMSGDVSRMRTSRQAVLSKLAQRIPERFSASLVEIQERYLALRNSGVDAAESGDGLPPTTYAFVENFAERRVAQGSLDASAVWEATLDGESRKAIFVPPETAVEFRIPGGAAGVLTTAVTLHPDTWDKPETRGGALFAIAADDGVSLEVLVNPHDRPADRRWHDYALSLPAVSGEHRVVLRTRSVGPIADFRWCLFRTPVFRSRLAAEPQRAAAGASGRIRRS